MLDGADVIVCCGSGGVGKTTTAAVIGLQAAAAGRRAVVVTIDPARRLADALGLPDGLAAEPQRIELEHEVAAGGELWAMMLDTAAAFDALVRRTPPTPSRPSGSSPTPSTGTSPARSAGRRSTWRPRRCTSCTTTSASTSWSWTRRRAATPSTSCEAPGVLARFLDHRLFRLLMLPARRGMRVVNVATQPLLRAIGRVVGSDVLADAVAFFQAFAGMEQGFRQRADVVIGLLRSDATRYVVVASPHRDTVTEAVWFTGQLGEQGIERVARRRQPGPPDVRVRHRGRRPQAAAVAAEAAGDAAQAALWRNLAELRALAEAARDELAPFDALLGRRPLVAVPLLAGDVHDLATLDEVRRWLFPDLTVEPVGAAPGTVAADARAAWPPTRPGSSTSSSPRSAAPSTSFTVVHRGPRGGQGHRRRRRTGPTTSGSSTCRSARWAAWP